MGIPDEAPFLTNISASVAKSGVGIIRGGCGINMALCCEGIGVKVGKQLVASRDDPV